MRGSVASHFARKIGQLICVRPRNIACRGGAVSFTFDDFPKSAIETGGAILEKHGLRGTYYTAFGLAGSSGDLGPMADLDDIRAVHERGHELACHTYTHLDCSRAKAAAILADLQRNSEEFAARLDGFAPQNFAYPYGRYVLRSRRLVAPHFASCRGTSGGINQGKVDLADLRGTRIYAPQFDEIALRALIDRNCAVGGWLIFYTHDVAEEPSPYGCTPRQFAAIVEYAAERAAVLPVSEVLASLPDEGLQTNSPARGSRLQA